MFALKKNRRRKSSVLLNIGMRPEVIAAVPIFSKAAWLRV